ncbi:hypothetical protein [uncultured Erythrobacter sp.]|uniref:hypothetical protein n=1 Tax=uncultured Erythrobacter sp. TaxID=263913 RepID=UPI0026283A60|nr:hypothetical protein [uncultured Erythrobacter sp.]
MSSSIFYGAAALTALVTFFVHVIAGGRAFVRPFQEVDMDPNLKWLAYYSWHIASLVIALIALAFWAAWAWPIRSHYAMVATSVTVALVVLAMAVSVKGELRWRAFPGIPLFSVISLLGLVGIVGELM